MGGLRSVLINALRSSHVAARPQGLSVYYHGGGARLRRLIWGFRARTVVRGSGRWRIFRR